jgi:4-hydroxy 2-oxovalerate aldolase
LCRAGQRKFIGGQQDQLFDLALEMKREQAAGVESPRYDLRVGC